MKSLLLILTFCQSTLVYPQSDTIRETFEDGSLKSIFWSVDGNVNLILYYQNGNKKESSFTDETGTLSEEWFENGKLSKSSKTDAGFPISCVLEMVSENLAKTTACYYQEQQVHLTDDNVWRTLSGEVLLMSHSYKIKEFYENGLLKSSVEYVNGSLLVETWDAEGNQIEQKKK